MKDPKDFVGKMVRVGHNTVEPQYVTLADASARIHIAHGNADIKYATLADAPKPARIHIKHLTIKGTPCVEILGFECIKKKDELPEEYCRGGPAFWVADVSGHGCFHFDGRAYRYFGNDATGCINLRVPPTVDLGGHIPIIHPGDVYCESDWQAIFVWLKRAGSRLAKIRRKEAEKQKSEWVEI